MSKDEEQADSYIIFAQANLWKSPNASNELGYYVDSLMRNYRYDSPQNAGIVINRKPDMDDNYAQRLKNVGIIVDDYDNVLSRPSQEERKQYKATYKKAQAKLAKEKREKYKKIQGSFMKAAEDISTSSSDASHKTTQNSQNSIPQNNINNLSIEEQDPRSPAAFVIGIQEPHFLHKKIPGLRGHKLLIDLKDESPRTAIYYSKNLDIWGVEAFTNKDMCTGIYVDASGRKIYITSLYMPSTETPDNMITDSISDLIKKVKEDKADLIVMADANSWSSLWGMKRENDRGKRLEDFIMGNNLQVLNQGNRYTYVRYNSQTIVDITLATSRVAKRIEHWRVRDALAYSDHCSIEFVLKDKGLKPIYKRNLRKGDWDMYANIMDLFSDPSNPQNGGTILKETEPCNVDMLEAATHSYWEDTESALNQTVPYCRPLIKIPGFSWYTKKHAKLKREVRKIRKYVIEKNEMLMDPLFEPKFTDADWLQARRKYRSACKKSRHEFYKQNLNKMNTPSQVAALSRSINKKMAPEVGLMKKDGKIQGMEESIHILADTHFPGSKNTPCKDARTKKDKFVDLQDESVSWITESKLKSVIDSFSPYKGPGPSGHQPIVYQKVGKLARLRLVNIIRASILLHHVPDLWLRVKVIFIPKAGKDNYSDPRSYRPISLMEFLLKIMEKLILWRIIELILSLRPLHRSQHGFTIGRSTDSAHTSLVTRIEHGINRKYRNRQYGFVLAVFLDIQGAYDNLSNRAIITALRKRGVDNNFISWILDFLKFRRISINYKGIQVEKFPTKGVPQGGVLSPYLWNDAHDSFLEIFDSDPVMHAECYADDCVLVTAGPNLEELQRRIQKAVDKCVIWAKRQGLTFSAIKTEVMVFTRKRKSNYQLPKQIEISGQPVKYSDLVKYLGIWLDRNLEYKAHLDIKLKHCKKMLMAMINSMGREWGIPPLMALWAWRAIVRPALLFGCLVWGHILPTTWAMDKTKSLQSLAFRLMTYYRRSTPIAGLEMMTNTWPIDVQARYLQACAFMRTRGFQSHSDNEMYANVEYLKGHRQKIEEWLYRSGGNAHQIIDAPVDDLVRKIIWEKQFQICRSSMTTGKNYGKADHETDFVIFTDGSKDEEGFAGGGLAPYRRTQEEDTFIEGGQHHFHLGKSSIFQAEMYMIYRAAEYIKTFIPYQAGVYEVFIYTDNRACVYALDSHETKSDLVAKTVSALNEAVLTTGTHIYISWVKGHSGCIGNDRADTLANLGRSDRGNPVADLPALSFKYCKTQFWRGAVNYWHNRWDRLAEIPFARQTRIWFPKSRPDFSTKILMTKRRILSKYILIFSGHNFWNRHQYLVTKKKYDQGKIEWNDVQSPICNYCQTVTEIDPDYREGEDGRPVQTSEHLFKYCEFFTRERLEIFGHLYLENLHQIKLPQILRFIEATGLDPLPEENPETAEINLLNIADEEENIDNN